MAVLCGAHGVFLRHAACESFTQRLNMTGSTDEENRTFHRAPRAQTKINLWPREQTTVAVNVLLNTCHV